MFMRFSPDAKTKYLIVENSKTSQQLISAIKQRTSIVKNIIENKIPAIEGTKYVNSCIAYTDLQLPANEKITLASAFPQLKEKPDDVFFGIQNVDKFYRSDPKANTDPAVGEQTGTVMTDFEDPELGLTIRVKSFNLSNFDATFCYLTKSTIQSRRLKSAKSSASSVDSASN